MPAPRPIRRLVFDESNLEHIDRHNVDREEVADVCFTPRLLRNRRDGTKIAYGKTAEGRYIIVVLVPRGRGAYYVITARDMTSSERRRYRAHLK